MRDDERSIIDSTASFDGELVGINITVKGRFKGKLEASGELRIVEGSNMEATIKAARVEIGGTFRGEVEAETLHLLEGGSASGRFRAQKLSVTEGAALEGDLEIGKPPVDGETRPSRPQPRQPSASSPPGSTSPPSSTSQPSAPSQSSSSSSPSPSRRAGHRTPFDTRS